MEFFRRLHDIRAISFDLDDTLYDNRPVIERAEQWMVDHMRDTYLQTAMYDRAWWHRLKLQLQQEDPLLREDVTLCRKAMLQRGLVSGGMSEEEAKVEAAKAVAIPGTSEHQLGLAVDLVDANMQDLTSAQESTETQKWLMANSWRYGFIHRYPNGKTDITGIIYEPWHYRYVGKDAAQEIFNRDITLEEYLGKTEH